jgi:SAM-dependent methyltransferase
MSIKACVDEPIPGALTYRHSVTVRGFAFSTNAARTVTKVSVFLDGRAVGSTISFFDRPDVRAAFDSADPASGFEVLCDLDIEPPDDSAQLEVVAHDSAGTVTQIGRIPIRVAATDYRSVDYGGLINRSRIERWTRDRIYGNGPPSPRPSLGCLALIKRYVRRGDELLDVGCGIGAYAEPLIDYGVKWTGCEASELFCDRVTARGLQCARVAEDTLPFAAQSFDCSICIEVLEHIAQPDAFVAEIARVSRRAACFSVPNAELIPLMCPLGAIPWHLLESDHKSFFSRQSLLHLLSAEFAHVEVLEYAPLPIKSVDGLPLPCHLFAIASHA